MSDHQHMYPMGDPDPACHICRERKSATELDIANAQTLAEHTARAVLLMRDELQRLEDEAADRMQKAEYWARMQELRAERDGNDAA